MFLTLQVAWIFRRNERVATATESSIFEGGGRYSTEPESIDLGDCNDSEAASNTVAIRMLNTEAEQRCAVNLGVTYKTSRSHNGYGDLFHLVEVEWIPLRGATKGFHRSRPFYLGETGTAYLVLPAASRHSHGKSIWRGARLAFLLISKSATIPIWLLAGLDSWTDN